MELCICIPARNEARRLETLLPALAAQTWPGVIPVSLVINNTNDDSDVVVERAAKRFRGRLAIHAEQVMFPKANAHAGTARRRAMDKGLSLASRADAVLVSTDADTRPPPQWLERTASAFERGADMVGGRIVLDPQETLPEGVRAYRQAWDRYWQAVRAVEDAIDPRPWDPAPRHGDHTGASLAIRSALYAACGGVPPIPTGEDRALVAAAIGSGGRLAHPLDVFTYVSARRDGRAAGGMSLEMERMFANVASGRRPMAPSLDHWRLRAAWRRELRRQDGGDGLIARREPMLEPMPNDIELEIVP
ncbi:glycosyltransferase family A protein [Novosphingobium sp. PhB55]|uniref:glycosyltransferase n=1 Tax=Novosphingobium sp. PhB55 TaxID=2485106 RepID=UPI001FBA4C0B|nr:glycosyltransferase family A protein [Novosphingobium sp. PhB55]